MKKPVRSSLQNLSISYEGALAIGNSLDLSEMLHEVIHTMVHKTNAHHGIIWVKNGEQELRPVASAGITLGDVLAQCEIMDLQNVFNQILKSRQFVLRYKDDDDFLQYCPVLTGKEESVLIVPVTNVAILYLVYASREIADMPLANLLVGLSKKLSVAIEACTAHKNIIKEIQVRVEAEEELQKKTEQLISSEKELQGLYGESEQARKSLLSILEDVTQKENALRESEEKYRNIIENIQDIFYRADMEGNLVMISLAGAKQMGYDSAEAMMGLNVAKTFYAVPEERDGFLKVLEKTGVVNDYEITLKRKDGTFVPVRASSHIFFDKSGNPLGVEGLLSDLTERKAAEKAIRESEEKLRMITASANDAILMMDPEGNISYWNKAAVRMFGYTEEEALGKDLHALFIPERFHAAFSKGFERFKETGQGDALGKTLEVAAFGKDGTEFPVELSLSAVKLKGRWNAMGLIRDITERKRAEQEIENLQRYNRGLIEVSIDLLVTFDQEGIIMDVNGAMIHAIGRTREELIGTPFADHFTDPDRAYKGAMLTFEVGEVRDYEMVMKASDGTETIVLYNASTYRDQTGKVVGAFAAAHDITGRKAAEDEIKKKTEELKGFNKLAVGRELKMIELKKEINALLGKLGEEPGYEIAGES